MKSCPYLAVIGLMALAGCSDKEDTAAAPAGKNAAAPVERASPEQSARNAAKIADAVTDKLEPGLWKQTITIVDLEMPGIPAVARRALETQKGTSKSFQHCLTPEQAARPDPEFFGNDASHDCSYNSFSRSGDLMTISMTCGAEGGRQARTDMQGSVGQTSFDLAMTTNMLSSPNGKMSLSGKLTGERIGECKG